MLNQQQIAAARKQLNITPQAPAGVDRSADFASAMGTAPAAPAAPVSTDAPAANPIVETGENYMKNVAPAANDAMGGGNIGAAVDDFSKGDIGGGIEKSTLGVVSDAAQAIFAPIAAPIQTLLTHVVAASKQNAADGKDPVAAAVIAAAGSPEAQAAKQQIADWAKAHPDIAQLFGDSLNVGLSSLGSGALDSSVFDVAKGTVDSVTGAVTDTATAAKNAVVGTPEEQAAAATAKASAAKAQTQTAVTSKLSQSGDTMTAGMKKTAVTEGRQVITDNTLGGEDVTYKPTKEINRAGEIMSDPEQVTNPIKATDKPNTVVEKVQAAISEKGAGAEKFLRDNPVEVTPQDETQMLNKMREEASSNSTPAQMKAYNDQIGLFQKQLEKKYMETGTLNTGDYYEALKSYEANVASKFSGGKEALIDPEGIGSANIQAAADLRSSVRDLIGSKHPEFKPQMYDLTSLYEARDNAIFNASKVKSKTVFDKNPRLKAAAQVAGTFVGGEGIRKVVTGGF